MIFSWAALWSFHRLPFYLCIGYPMILTRAALQSFHGLPYNLCKGCSSILLWAALLAVNGLPAGKRKQTQCEYWILMYAAYKAFF